MFKQRYKQANDRIHAPITAWADMSRTRIGTNRDRMMRFAAACVALLVLATATATLLDLSPQNGTSEMASAYNVADYSELFGYVNTAQNGGESGGFFGGRSAMTEFGQESDAQVQAPNAAQTEQSDKSYSDTNVQVEGVDEADVVKTDGTYIYRLLDNEIVIVRADGENMEIASRIQVGKSDESPMASEFYVFGDFLAVISVEYQWVYYNEDIVKEEDSEDRTIESSQNNENRTYVTIYDISDRTKPIKMNQMGQSGTYLTSRMVDGTLYLLSSYYVYNEIIRAEPDTFVPSVTNGNEKTLVAPQDIQVFEDPETPGYVVITSVDIQNAQQYQSVKAVLGSAGTVYASSNSLLIAASQYKMDRSDVHKDENGKNVITETYSMDTNLALFGIDGGDIVQKASATIPGMLNDQFSMDEYNGVFRIVTTVNTSTTKIYTDGLDTYEHDSYSANALYTLDQDLAVLGSIEDVAEGETVYSVRFDGDVGYFVTFRQVDPLFAVDLSDPGNPKVTSALKIPGFSDYLHVYDEGLLFGFGQDADTESGRTSGLKLSMFDVSDPFDVTEVHTEKLEANWSEASYNHKAILVDSGRSLIAFPAEGTYCVYGYDAQNGFYRKAKLDIGSDAWNGTLRGLFIDECFYVTSADVIAAYSLNSFEKLGSLELN